jgi:CNT family concentrative nucleoside transporter
MDKLRGVLGIAVILGLAMALSENRKEISRRVILWGLALQWLFALAVLRLPQGREAIAAASRCVVAVLSCADKGSEFVFGPGLARSDGPFGFVFAFRVLPTVIFVSALFAVLYHLGVMQRVVGGFAYVMARLMGTSGAESLDVAASLFLGHTEAPLTIRPYLPTLTRSEVMTVMTSGMAHVSGGTIAAYIALGVDPRFIMTSVVMTAPGAILMAKLLVPEMGVPDTLDRVPAGAGARDANLLDAASRGTREGLELALNIGAMLIAFIGLITLVNMGLGLAGTSLQAILGRVLAPVAYLLGVPWADSQSVGQLLGTRVVVNELVAYNDLAQVRARLSPRSVTIATFALCGFANVGSIGIQIGGIGALAPERRHDLARLGLKAMFAGTLANYLSACIAAVLV